MRHRSLLYQNLFMDMLFAQPHPYLYNIKTSLNLDEVQFGAAQVSSYSSYKIALTARSLHNPTTCYLLIIYEFK